MAFFDEKIDKLSKRYPPKSVQDCFRPDNLSQTLWGWAQNIENGGRVVFLILIICGLFVVITTGTNTYDELEYADNGMFLTFLAVLVVVLQWGLYSFVEYCAYHALSLLMGALASIVQSNRITSDLVAYNAGLIQKSMGIGEQSSDKHFTVEDLGELAKKKAQGLISDTEYEAQRNEILKHL